MTEQFKPLRVDPNNPHGEFTRGLYEAAYELSQVRKGVVFEEPVVPAPDGHLEDQYDLSQGEGFDWNEIEQGMWDDDPSPYDGTYSEE